MSASVTFDGLDELRQALLALPRTLADKSAVRVGAAAARAVDRIRAAYPEYTGNLRNHIVSKVERDSVSVLWTVKNTAHHAWIFENGTQVRHTATGANRGEMPPGHVFIPIVMQERRAMYQDLADIVAGEGLEVTVDAS
jgi:HK97 gp10 family phage protein